MQLAGIYDVHTLEYMFRVPRSALSISHHLSHTLSLSPLHLPLLSSPSLSDLLPWNSASCSANPYRTASHCPPQLCTPSTPAPRNPATALNTCKIGPSIPLLQSSSDCFHCSNLIHLRLQVVELLLPCILRLSVSTVCPELAA
jgi:hypothetical protein